MKHFLHALKNTFNYNGRAGRAEFGWFYLICFLIYFVLDVIAYRLDSYSYNARVIISSYVITVFFFWYLIAALCLISRRLHDIGKSGWWLLAGFYTPVFVFLTLGFAGLLNDVDSDSRSLVTTITVWFMFFYFCFIVAVQLWLLFKKGEPTKNQYGEVPKTLK